MLNMHGNAFVQTMDKNFTVSAGGEMLVNCSSLYRFMIDVDQHKRSYFYVGKSY